jgi:hypothetical protein
MVGRKNFVPHSFFVQEMPGGKLPLVLAAVVLVLGHALRTVRHENG